MTNVNVISPKECCGCKACEQICPTNCISMVLDMDTFTSPYINNEKCIQCGLCLKVCQVKGINTYEDKFNQKVLAVKSKDTLILESSSSGGMFSVLANFVLKLNGVVFGCSLEETLSAKQILVNNKNDLYKLRGSKYVQSDVGDSYKLARDYLRRGTYVLYSGTPCQISGLKKFLGKKYDNLITIDIICHGVPSQLLFEKYLVWLEKKYSDKLVSYNFRSKVKSDWEYVAEVKMKSKIKYLKANFDPYYRAFLKGLSYRECCYKCKYATTIRQGDITLGDFWGIEAEHPEFKSNKGVSLVLINTSKGNKLFNEIVNDIEYIESNIEKAIKRNENLSRPTKRPIARDNIYLNLKNIKFEEFINNNQLEKVGAITFIKAYIPRKFKEKLKKLL